MKLSKRIVFSLGLIGGALATGLAYADKKALSTVRLPENFTLTAHTGCEKTKDNSLAAISVAVVAGADIVEFDLNFNKEGIAVLSHDDPDGNAVTLEQAFELLNLYKHLRVNIDVKKTDDLKQVVLLAEKYSLKDRIFFTGIMPEFVESVKDTGLGVPYFLNKNIDATRKNDDGYINEMINEVVSAGACGLNTNYRNCTAKIVEMFHDNNLQVSVWTVNSRLDMTKVLKLGADNITTRKPAEYKKIIDIVKRVR